MPLLSLTPSLLLSFLLNFPSLPLLSLPPYVLFSLSLSLSSLLAEHEDLKEKCRGDGESSCILCGYDFDQPNAEKSTLCYICAKVSVTNHNK